MYVRFTTTDSTGTPVTKQLTITLGSKRHEISVADTGTARVPRAVGEHLVRSSEYAVEAYESDSEDEFENEDGGIESAAAGVVDETGDGGGSDD